MKPTKPVVLCHFQGFVGFERLPCLRNLLRVSAAPGHLLPNVHTHFGDNRIANKHAYCCASWPPNIVAFG